MNTNKSWPALRPASGTAPSLYRQVIIAITAALFLLLSGGVSLLADTHYVSIGNKRPKSPYTSWSSAATTIQQAVDAATAGDEVVVGDGVYATGWRELWTLEAHLYVRVYIPNAIVLRSLNGPQTTVIDGGLQVSCIVAADGARLTGFTVRNGSGQSGGIYCYSTNAVVTECVITRNQSLNGGGVIRGTLYNCALAENAAYMTGGGGVPPDNGEGGGAFGSILYNCVLTGNLGHTGGGASYCTLYNCVLNGNGVSGSWITTEFGRAYVGSAGGGAYFSSLFNCTLTGNSSTDRCGGAAYSELYNSIAILNTVAKSAEGANYDNSSTLNYCGTSPVPKSGSGNFSLNKYKTSALFVDYPNGNLRLRSGSPCINAGNNAYVSTSTDLEGNPRILGGIVDVGAYEFQGSPQ